MDVEAFVARLAMAAVQFLNVPAEFHYERDPKDTPYINLALVAQAEYLVTRDTDLLALMHETTEPGQSFPVQISLPDHPRSCGLSEGNAKPE